MTLRIVVDPEAESEIREAAGWYEDRLTGLGLQFVAAVDRALSSIAENPTHFQLWRQDPPSGATCSSGFVVFYEIEKDRVVIRAVAHGRREPGYWIARRPP